MPVGATAASPGRVLETGGLRSGVWAACAQVLNLELFDHDTFDPDDRLGMARLPVRDLHDGSERDTWLDVDLAPVQEAEKEVYIPYAAQETEYLGFWVHILMPWLCRGWMWTWRPCRTARNWRALAVRLTGLYLHLSRAWD